MLLNRSKYFLTIASLGFVFAACTQNSDAKITTILESKIKKSSKPFYSYEIINKYPHDHRAMNEGFVYHDFNDKEFFYESVGEKRKSSLRQLDFDDEPGPLKLHKLDNEIFAEGITILDNVVYQLTYESKIIFKYDLTQEETDSKSFASPIHLKMPFDEGWGLTNHNGMLIAGDGTHKLYEIDPADMTITRTFFVKDGEHEIDYLNELEMFVNENGQDEILANIYQTTYIAKINPNPDHNGVLEVTGYIDIAGLVKAEKRQGREVSNGIAYDKKGERLFVTGKFWKNIYEIKLK